MYVFADIYMRPSEKKDYLANLLIGMDIWGEWSSAWIQGHSVCSSMEMGRSGSEAVHGGVLYVCTTLLIHSFTAKGMAGMQKELKLRPSEQDCLQVLLWEDCSLLDLGCLA